MVEDNRVISVPSRVGQRAMASWGRKLEGSVGASGPEVEGGVL